MDIVLSGGNVFITESDKPIRIDVGIKDDKIVALGDLSLVGAALTLDVSGLSVAPGFIDLHSHALRRDVRRSGIYLFPQAENLIRQGVTTIIGGPDGGSPLPLAADFEKLTASPAAVNFGSFVGHGSVRLDVMGNAKRDPTPAELEKMRKVVEREMRSGAFGLSSGLIYTPGRFGNTEELISLAQVAARYDGIYISHMRSEGSAILEAVDEALRIGREASVPVQISHIKVMGKPNWGNAIQVLNRIDDAQRRGQDVSADQYPFAASSTGLTATFPGWALAGTPVERRQRLQDAETRDRLQQEIVRNLVNERGGADPSRVRLAHCPFDPSLDGKTITEVLAVDDSAPTIQQAAILIMDLQAAGGCTAVYHAMDETDLRAFLRHPTVMVASDGGIVMPGVEMPHPRNYGAFTRVLAHYARDEDVLSLHAAIAKMTRLPATRIGLEDRGRIRIGNKADIVVFDVDALRTDSTFPKPHAYAEGMLHVMVNGEFVLKDAKLTAAKPGAVLRNRW